MAKARTKHGKGAMEKIRQADLERRRDIARLTLAKARGSKHPLSSQPFALFYHIPTQRLEPVIFEKAGTPATRRLSRVHLQFWARP